MSFLTPLFLAALVGLGVPLLIHMIQRQRTELLEFPSLMFVRKIPFHSMRRQRIRHWLLLLLRCAALALLVAAFARPFLRSNALASVTGGAREVVVLIDRSYSMGFGDRWDRARAAARGIEVYLEGGRACLGITAEAGAKKCLGGINYEVVEGDSLAVLPAPEADMPAPVGAVLGLDQELVISPDLYPVNVDDDPPVHWWVEEMSTAGAYHYVLSVVDPDQPESVVALAVDPVELIAAGCSIVALGGDRGAEHDAAVAADPIRRRIEEIHLKGQFEGRRELLRRAPRPGPGLASGTGADKGLIDHLPVS